MRRATATVAEVSLRLLETQVLVLNLVDRVAGERDCLALGPDAALQDLMAVAVKGAPWTETAWVLDAHGFLCVSSNPQKMDERSRAFRDYFSGARDAGPGGHHVGRAILGLVDGVPAFSVARRRGDGREFRGIVLTSIHLGELIAQWQRTVLVAPTQRVALFRADGATIARSWHPVVPEPDAAAEARIAEIWRNVAEDAAVLPSITDDTRRVTAWRSLPEWGVVVTSSIAQDAALAPWRIFALWSGAAAALASGLLWAFLWTLARARTQLEAANVTLEARVAWRTKALSESEEELRRLNDELEARVRSEVEAREAAQARLAHAQRMEALGQLAGGIAHDFNNVLQTVQSGARLIEQQPADEARTRRLARMVAEAAQRGASVTRRLLAFSRRAELRAEAVEPEQLLVTLRDMLAHTLGAGIKLRLRIAPGLPPLLADKGQLETVLVNLTTNARDAMDGRGTITLAASDITVRPNAAVPGPGTPGRYVRLDIGDTGSGMDAATLARAVEPFFTTKAQGHGTGLGLAMARGFAEQSGGALHIESEPGKGTTVTLWFPLAAGMEAPTTSGASVGGIAAAGSATVRVLLVEDEALVRQVTAEGLEAAGYAVTAAPSAQAALEILHAGEPIDLIVSDLSMPDMDGLALAKAARRKRPGLPLILLTGFVADLAEVALSGVASGPFSMLRKPVEHEVLAGRIAAVLAEAATPQGRS